MRAGDATMTSRALLAACAVLIIGGCGSGGKMLVPQRMWPDPPAEPIVKFESAVYGSRDLGYSLWQRIQNFIFGAPPGDRIGKPYGICTDESRWYIADTDADRVLVLDWDDRESVSIQRLDGKRRLVEPVNVAIGPDKKIYVADTGLKGVARFQADGTFDTLFGDSGELDSPVGMAWDREGRLLVADSKKHRVAVFADGGELLTTFGEFGDQPGQFYHPLGIAIAPDGTIYVVDAFHFTVQRFDKEFRYLGDFGHDEQTAATMPRPRAVDVDQNGRVYVTDAIRHMVLVFDPEGALLYTFGNQGTGAGEFRLPAGIVVAEDGRILVVDSLNRRVLKFQLLRG